MQSSGHKVLIFSQMVCFLDFLEDLLRFKHSKYERLNVLKFASHQASAVDWCCKMSYQSFFIVLITKSGGLGIDLPVADTNIIFDNDWNPQLRTTLSALCAQRR